MVRYSGGEVVGFSDRLREVAKALAPNQCGLDSILGVDGLSLLLAFFSAPRFSLPGYSGFLILFQIPIRLTRKCLQIVGDNNEGNGFINTWNCHLSPFLVSSMVVCF